MITHPKISWLCLMVLFALNGNAQHFSPKIDAVGLFSSELRVIRPGLEVSFARHFSAGLTYEKGKFASGSIASYTLSSGSSPYDPASSDSKKEVYRMTGWGLTPEFRYYPFTAEKPAPAGFFVGGYFNYRQLNEIYTGYDALLSSGFNRVMANVNSNVSIYSGGCAIGFKRTVGIFALEFLGGVGGSMAQWKTPNERERIDPDFVPNMQTNLRLEINIGFVFPKIKREKAILENVPSSPTADPAMQELAKVVIFRERRLRGSGVTYKRYANDSLLTTMENGSYFEYACKPGTVKFLARTVAVSTITLQLEKGRTYYLLCGVRSGMVYKDPGFDLLPPEKGERRAMKVRK